MEENGFFEAFDANGGRGIVNEERGEIKRAAESADSRRETFDQGLPPSLSLSFLLVLAPRKMKSIFQFSSVDMTWVLTPLPSPESGMPDT